MKSRNLFKLVAMSTLVLGSIVTGAVPSVVPTIVYAPHSIHLQMEYPPLVMAMPPLPSSPTTAKVLPAKDLKYTSSSMPKMPKMANPSTTHGIQHTRPPYRRL